MAARWWIVRFRVLLLFSSSAGMRLFDAALFKRPKSAAGAAARVRYDALAWKCITRCVNTKRRATTSVSGVVIIAIASGRLFKRPPLTARLFVLNVKSQRGWTTGERVSVWRCIQDTLRPAIQDGLCLLVLFVLFLINANEQSVFSKVPTNGIAHYREHLASITIVCFKCVTRLNWVAATSDITKSRPNRTFRKTRTEK